MFKEAVASRGSRNSRGLGRGLTNAAKIIDDGGFSRGEDDLKEVLEEKETKKKKKEKKSSTLSDFFFERILTKQNALDHLLHRFNFRNRSDALIINNAIVKYSVGMMTNTSTIYSHKSHMFTTGRSIACIDGIWFLVIDHDSGRSTESSIYVLVWQKEQALEWINKTIFENLPTRCLNGTAIPDSKVDQIQFMRDSDYEVIDRRFKRMVEEPNWYKENGKKFKEVILMYGPPGTGKSNLAIHLAAKWELNVITPEATQMGNEETTRWLAEQRDDRPTVILLEDIDAYAWLRDPNAVVELEDDYPMRGKRSDPARDKANNVASYARFINALDGAEAYDNVIVILTTNFIDHLIPSIHRRGRVDLKIPMVPLTTKEICVFIDTPVNDYIEVQPDGTFSIADIIDLRNCKTKEDVDIIIQGL